MKTLSGLVAKITTGNLPN